jgi:beta-lactamase regulating signal transducer with metallopeptidase domain
MSYVLENLNDVVIGVMSAVLNSVWQALAVVLLTWVTLKFTPRINAATRFVVWWAVLIVSIALPIGSRLITAAPPRPEVAPPTLVSSSASTELVVAPDPLAITPAVAPRGPALPLEFRTGAWPLWIFAVWSTVFLFHVARIVCSYGYLHGIRRRSRAPSRELRLNFDEWLLASRVRRPVQLLLSNEIASPMAVGFLRPTVILPEPLLDDFTKQELDHVILHELAHVARSDDWTNLMGRLATALLVLHPVAAWVLRKIEGEREIASDDWVVAMTGSARPYATMLTRLFELCHARRQELLASGMAIYASQFGTRIEMLLRRGREFAPRASLVRVVLSAMILLVLSAVGAHTPSWIAFAQEPTPPLGPDPPTVQSRQPELPVTPTSPRKAFHLPSVPHSAASPTAPPAPALPPIPAEGPITEPLTSVEPTSIEPSAIVQPAIVERPTVQPAIVEPATIQPIAAIAETPVAPPQVAASAQPWAKGSLLAALVANGYGDLSVDEIIDLKNNGVSADFVSGMNHSGWGKLTPRELVDLQTHGISPDYLQRIHQAGFNNLTLQDVIEMRMHGVRPENVREIHSLGFGPYRPKQAIEFANNGVQPQLFRALKEAGFAHVDPDEIINAQINGLRAENLREAKPYGSKLTLKQIIRLKQAGVI